MKEISAPALLNYPPEQLVDVRENAEVRSGIIPGAIHIPLGEIPGRMQELDKSMPVTIICRSGNRSAHAAEYLESFGYETVNVTGGMKSWPGEISR
ncbi:rhodanese-like domain-containing protein [Alkalicoccus urumqiensis]|uniref:Rhodanese n=1 Tax=Alkalicoccus urumqiensis TaxID=1548213 RepID=A0A2P6MEU4_ALKUR|nr:rhodanese-like domain-containing protein [Alkalicoccus urumqiensis]PRO64822.1 rhodanese [Alkalicoccus urumqiensis]